MPHTLSIILEYLVSWSWRAYFKPKDHQIIGRPHGATILDRVMKNETPNPTHPFPSSQIMDETGQKPKCTIFPSLIGGINFPSISYKHRKQPGGIFNTQECAMKFLPQAAQYYGHLWRQNYDDKLVRVSGIFSRPGSVTYSVLTKF